MPEISRDALPFEQLDFLYLPSNDVSADAKYFAEVLGGRVKFAIEGMGARVAMVELGEGPPRILFADHLDGERAVLVYRVANLAAVIGKLEARGWKRERTFEIPQGPCCSFRTAGGHRIALYELARPDVEKHFEGRRDF